jgi:uncharacterized membrane-anchored protein
MKRILPFFLAFLLSFSNFLVKGEDADSAVVASKDSFQFQYLHFDTTGVVTLGTGIASFNVSKEFKFLNPSQSQYVLHDLWRNPPDPEVLGMIFPSEASPIIPQTWAIVVTYEEEGHVKDDDAKDIKYDELLKTIKQRVEESNPERLRQGYRAFHILGWAEPPYYDEKEKKLHWAKKLIADGDTLEQLNYNIRILGRKGVLVLNAIGNMTDLEEIKANINPILANVNFTKGNQYGDFNASMDQVAAYGIGGLIAGGVLLKTGLLSKLGLILLKFIKPILVGAAAVGGSIWKFFTGRGKDDSAA